MTNIVQELVTAALVSVTAWCNIVGGDVGGKAQRWGSKKEQKKKKEVRKKYGKNCKIY